MLSILDNIVLFIDYLILISLNTCQLSHCILYQQQTMPISPKIVLWLVLVAPVLTQSFSSYQLTFFEGVGSPTFYVYPTHTYTYSYPQAYNASFARGLALSSISFQMNHNVSFAADVVSTSDWADVVQLTINADVGIILISFNLILTNASSSLVWQQSIPYSPTVLNSFVSMSLNQGVWINFDHPPVSSATHAIVLFYKDFIAVAATSNQVRIEISLGTGNSTGTYINLMRNDNLKIVQYISLGLVVATTISANIDVSGYGYPLTLDQPTFADKFIGRPNNFGINQKYNNAGNFDGSCMLAIFQIRMPYNQTSTGVIDMTSYPINAYQTVTVARPYKFMVMNFVFLCVKQTYTGFQCLDFGFQYCASCTPRKCLMCENDFVRDSGWAQCRCILGSPLMGICNTIDGCIHPVIFAGQKSCLACNSTYFYAQPLNGLCVCLQGNLTNGICNTISGCSAPSLSPNGAIICLACNVSSNFAITPSAPTQCSCKTGYTLEKGVCVDICGDGMVVSSDKNACDDGNLNNEDGCSSTCQVETYYRCDNTQSPSLCLYAGIPVNLTLKYSERPSDDNRGLFAFQLYPPLLFLNTLAAQDVSFICNSDYSIRSVSYSNGMLKIETDYTRDMEGVQCTLSVNFNRSALIDSNNITFTVVSRNQKLVVISDSVIERKKRISFIFEVLSYIVLGIFLVSLGCPMVGVELIFHCQIIYFSYALYLKRSYLAQAITNFKLVTGFRNFFYQSDTHGQLMYPYCSILELTKQGLQNNTIWTALILLIIILVGFMLVHHIKNQSEQSQQESILSIFFKSTKMQSIYQYLIFPIAIFNIIIAFLSLGISSKRQGSNQGTFGAIVNGLDLLLLLAVPAIVLAIQIMRYQHAKQSDDRDTNAQLKNWYILYFTVKIILISLLIVTSIQTAEPSLLYLITPLLLVSTVSILVTRPYSSIFSSLTLISCQFAAHYACVLGILSGVMDLNDDAQIFMLLVLEGFIMIALTLTLIRIMKHYYGKIRAKLIQNAMVEEKNAFNQMRENANPKTDKKQNKIHQQDPASKQKNTKEESHLMRYLREGEHIKNASIMRRVMEQNQQDVQQQGEQLSRIKKRLRKGLLNKKEKQKRKNNNTSQ